MNVFDNYMYMYMYIYILCVYMWFEMVAELSFICFLCRIRHMQGLRETQLSADVELLPITETAKQKQGAKPPISLNFEVPSLSRSLSLPLSPSPPSLSPPFPLCHILFLSFIPP